MGKFFGDIHYGLKISKKIEMDENIFLEPIYEVKFDNPSILLNDYLDNIKNIYSNLLKHDDNYQYELYVDIFTTYNNITGNKDWQKITKEEMVNFIDNKYKIDYLKNEV